MRKTLKSVHASARRFVFLDGKASWLRRPFWYGYLKNEADNELRYPVLSDFAKGVHDAVQTNRTSSCSLDLAFTIDCKRDKHRCRCALRSDQTAPKPTG